MLYGIGSQAQALPVVSNAQLQHNSGAAWPGLGARGITVQGGSITDVNACYGEQQHCSTSCPQILQLTGASRDDTVVYTRHVWGLNQDQLGV